MPLPASLQGKLELPLIASPMFIVSGPEIVIAACKAGVVGTFPSLNARPIEAFEQWLNQIEGELAAAKEADPNARIAPYGVNLIVHKSNPRAQEDLAIIEAHKVPVVITSVGHPGEIAERVHAYGGVVFHDIINLRHAQKAKEAGVDGIILVCSGAGGHAGVINPFTLVPQVREFFDGTIILAGTLSNGKAIRAAEVLGADLAYMGTRFIATTESRAPEGYKQMILDSGPLDVVYTDKVSGINANFIKASLDAAGIDYSKDLPTPEITIGKKGSPEDVGHEPSAESEAKAWKEVWSAGQGVGEIHDVPSVAELVARFKEEYDNAV